MRLSHSDEFERERTQYRFAFTCESCAHFDRRRERCRHEYPTDEHRQAYYQEPRDLVFCKEFELE